MIEFIVWQIRLWLVGYREKVKHRQWQLASTPETLSEWLWPTRQIRNFVDKVSPWNNHGGYRRRRLRRFLWMATHPMRTQRTTSLRYVVRLLTAIAPYTGPGKYEGMDAATALKVEWLDQHMEYADREEGSVETLFVALFLNLDVPWSRTGESWILAIDSQGFVTGFQPDNPKATFDQYAAAYMGGDEDIEDDDPEPWSNREGQPEFNGAFR